MPDVTFEIQLDAPTRLFDGTHCWAHARAGVIPGGGRDGMPRVVLVMLRLNLEGSDVFEGAYQMLTDDLGKTWTAPESIAAFRPQVRSVDGTPNIEVRVGDPVPQWHPPSRTLLLTMHTACYQKGRLMPRPRPRRTIYSTFNPARGTWNTWNTLVTPFDETRFHNSGAGSTQRVDLSDGTILLPFHFYGRTTQPNAAVTVARCRFDGQTLHYVEHGDEIKVQDGTRGLYEPSLTTFKGAYFLTIRHDHRGYVTRSADGSSFEPLRTWTFDDGHESGNYCTQQHWVTHSDALFLVYTRRGADNDHVFRHRAPLFIAQVDPKRLCLIRETERVLVPERGARLGNFGVTHVSPDESWVTVSEWMQPKGVERYGSDGSLFVARILWDRPNSLFDPLKAGEVGT